MADGSTITNVTNPQYGSNPNDTLNASPAGLSPTDPGYQSMLNQNLAWFQNNPSLLSRYMMGKSGSGMQGNVYGNDPYSQFLQNRALAASTLAEYINPGASTGAGNSGSMSNFLPGAQDYMSNLSNIPSILAAINAFAPDVQNMASATGFQSAYGNGGSGQGGNGQAGGWQNALSAWNLTDPTEVSKVFQAAAAGLPSPLANAASGLISHLYQMYQDLSPGLGGKQFFPWLAQYF